jgi:DNA-binding CsgD family transcriptional regulator
MVKSSTMSLPRNQSDPRAGSTGTETTAVTARAESAPGSARALRVAVWEENEIVRGGLIAALTDDRRLQVMGARLEQIDVAVVSSDAAEAKRFPCPIVICCERHTGDPAAGSVNDVVGVLDRSTLTAAQLRATVHAAAAGLRIAGVPADDPAPQLDTRSRQVLEMLADGFSTREIADRMSYSERTIKKLVTRLQHYFKARSRAQIVARAIRDGLI